MVPDQTMSRGQAVSGNDQRMQKSTGQRQARFNADGGSGYVWLHRV